MCLLVLAWQVHPRYRLVVAANRDEFHDRPSAPLGHWSIGASEILGGRDLRAGGTWLALDARRRFGVVTNYRDLARSHPDAPSRGVLVPQFLAGQADPGSYLAALEGEAGRYSGFNLLLSDATTLWYAGNRATPFARPLAPGIHALSNHLLDTPWPKLARVRRAFEAWIDADPTPPIEALLAMLADRTPASADEALPETGLAPEWERVLSAPFVLDPRYGTRSSTLVLLEPSGAGLFFERRFDAEGRASGDSACTLEASA